MNWKAVKRMNARRSQAKAKRERLAAEKDARVEAAGGPVTVGELRAATRRVEVGTASQRPGTVWTFRGRDWVVCPWLSNDGFSAYPYQPWRLDPDWRLGVPVTVGAAKWLLTQEWN